MSFDPQPAISVLQLRISLRALSPPVWRRVIVPEHLTLAHLHSVIQVVVGWTDEHLHQFTIRGRRNGEAHEGVLQFSTVTNELMLAAFSLREHEDFVYVYDFNAWWRHDMESAPNRVRATVTEIAQFKRRPRCGLAGLHLEEAKLLLGRLQRTMVAAQVAEAVARTSVCPTCSAQLTCKGHDHLVSYE